MKKLKEQWQKIGQYWLKGKLEGIDFGHGLIKFLPPQKKFIDSQKDYCVYYGGLGSGKTLALLIKLILCCLCFPGNRVLLGRQYLSDIERNLLPDLFDLLPSSYYKYHVKQGIIEFFNQSEVLLFGLDAMQSGSEQEIKKAQQKIKGLNLGQVFIDQLEEVEFEVFDMLNTRLRRKGVPFYQIAVTCNPANFWAYTFFIESARRDPKRAANIELVQGSMYDNKDNLPERYIERQIEGHSEDWIKRYILGEWSKDLLVQETVFDKAHIGRWELMAKPPIAVENGCQIWEQPKNIKYQIGVDPSEGHQDPSSITVASEEGKKVAKFNGFISIPGLADKVRFLYSKYHRPLIIPEVNGPGHALIENIRGLNLYCRTVFEHRDNKETTKLGWKTTHASK
ncbi:MAG TPA: hypothetical protein ENF68_00980, partial [bacterium]|nr:hypothetical protein [bacterium]